MNVSTGRDVTTQWQAALSDKMLEIDATLLGQLPDAHKQQLKETVDKEVQVSRLISHESDLCAMAQLTLVAHLRASGDGAPTAAGRGRQRERARVGADEPAGAHAAGPGLAARDIEALAAQEHSAGGTRFTVFLCLPGRASVCSRCSLHSCCPSVALQLAIVSILLCSQAYSDKILADAVDDREKSARQTLPEFLYDFYKHRFGVAKLAEVYLHELVSNLWLFVAHSGLLVHELSCLS